MQSITEATILRVDEAKIVAYLLNISGSHGKAGFFLVFGFRPDDWVTMADALKRQARSYPITVVVDSPYGTRYSVDGELETPSGRRPRVRAVWIREADSGELRLITAHPIWEAS